MIQGSIGEMIERLGIIVSATADVFEEAESMHHVDVTFELLHVVADGKEVLSKFTIIYFFSTEDEVERSLEANKERIDQLFVNKSHCSEPDLTFAKSDGVAVLSVCSTPEFFKMIPN